MGEPAAVIVKRLDSTVGVHTWRSGGYSLGQDLIERGVERLFAEGLEHGWTREPETDIFGSARAHLGWAESVLIVDETTQTLVWDLHCLEINSPRLVTHMIETTSPGWRAVWHAGDVDAAWRFLLGDPFAEWSEHRPQRDPWVAPDDWFAPADADEEGYCPGAIITAALPDDRTVCWASDKEPEYVRSGSAAALELIARNVALAQSKDLARFARWPLVDEESGYEDWPTGGVHLDFATRRAWVWHVFGLYWRDDDAGELARWPGWTFIDIGDCWEAQSGCTHCLPVAQPMRGVLYEALGFRSDGTPLTSGDYESWYHHPRVDALMRELLEAELELPPTAFLQTDGSICWEPMVLLGE